MSKSTAAAADQVFKLYERALKAVHAKKWPEAKKLLDELESKAEQADIRQRVSQFQDIVKREGVKAEARIQDPYMRAVYERNRGDLKTALALCTREGRSEKEDRYAFLAASIYTEMGELESAAKTLRRAIKLDPKNRAHARLDSDFEDLRESEEHQDIFESD